MNENTGIMMSSKWVLVEGIILLILGIALVYAIFVYTDVMSNGYVTTIEGNNVYVIGDKGELSIPYAIVFASAFASIMMCPALIYMAWRSSVMKSSDGKEFLAAIAPSFDPSMKYILLTSGSNTCPHCGAALGVTLPKFCPECGSKVTNGD